MNSCKLGGAVATVGTHGRWMSVALFDLWQIGLYKSGQRDGRALTQLFDGMSHGDSQSVRLRFRPYVGVAEPVVFDVLLDDSIVEVDVGARG